MESVCLPTHDRPPPLCVVRGPDHPVRASAFLDRSGNGPTTLSLWVIATICSLFDHFVSAAEQRMRNNVIFGYPIVGTFSGEFVPAGS